MSKFASEHTTPSSVDDHPGILHWQETMHTPIVQVDMVYFNPLEKHCQAMTFDATSGYLTVGTILD
jgi:hypothetical protein